MERDTAKTTISPLLPLAAGAFAILVFIIDTVTTLDIAIAVLYVVVVLLSASLFSRRGILLVAAGCMILTAAGFLLSHGSTAGHALLRCLVSIAAIMITTILALRHGFANAALRESERRYRHIFQATNIAILEGDLSQLRVAVEELKARGVSDFGQYMVDHPAFCCHAIDMVKIVDVNDATIRLLDARQKEDVLASFMEIFPPEAKEAFVRGLVTIITGQPSYSCETTMRSLEGGIIDVHFNMTLPHGSPSWENILISLVDVTERNRTQEELQRTQSELAHAMRMTMLGELTASIAHEINQPLAAIATTGQACLRWLNHETPQLNKIHSAVERIVRDGERASDVICQIRRLSRKGEVERTQLNLNDVIKEVVPLLRREVLSHRVALRLDLMTILPDVLGNRIQLQQVLVNLLVNGIQAMESVTTGPRELIVHSGCFEDGQVLISVTDTGIGIDKSDSSKLFEAFYTSKPNGMGLGLSICRSIIESHGGRIWATPNHGPGATFYFTLSPMPKDGA